METPEFKTKWSFDPSKVIRHPFSQILSTAVNHIEVSITYCKHCQASVYPSKWIFVCVLTICMLIVIWPLFEILTHQYLEKLCISSINRLLQVCALGHTIPCNARLCWCSWFEWVLHLCSKFVAKQNISITAFGYQSRSCTNTLNLNFRVRHNILMICTVLCVSDSQAFFHEKGYPRGVEFSLIMHTFGLSIDVYLNDFQVEIPKTDVGWHLFLWGDTFV